MLVEKNFKGTNAKHAVIHLQNYEGENTMNCSMWDELCKTNVGRIQRKYEEIEKRNKQRSKNIWEIPESKLQNDYLYHNIKIKYIQMIQNRRVPV